MKVFTGLFLFVLCSFMVFASSIHGTFYDIELNEVKDVIIEVNTNPPQVFVSKDSNYSLNIDKGEYILFAFNKEFGSVKRKIFVDSDGEYVLDLILFPSLEVESEFFNDSDIDLVFDSLDEPNDFYFEYFIVLLLVFLIICFIYFKRKKVVESVESLNNFDDFSYSKIINLIKGEGGRVIQRDLVRKLPFSEAKTSLILKELQEKGKISKIKQGNKNIIVLK